MESPPTPVPATAKQVGNAWDIRVWAEPSVWTERMLAALERGVKGGVWYSLIDKVYLPANLQAAWAKVHGNRGAAGVDHVGVEEFNDHSERNLEQIQRQLRRHTYRPQAIRRVYIPKPGSTQGRPLGIPICPAYCFSYQ